MVELNWTPGHTDTMGNEIVNRLAKEAAVEVEVMSEVATHLDISNAVRTLCQLKWQMR